ncbi:hypothetical protein ASF01_06075 [Stenotrophomonas sp. Leaf70]|uniref:GntR family transcriptional regulator n=1 Tax=Stenotrophomonas sp. Leaf70 TaxID=1736233 RepID=UPI0006F30FCE|nr:GntR family transcriptional regulator [Stenotrophomonas sp. Leaf70]KQO00509.1 hypothetical protein ASF01_06075 [Stenotrophomonas sp. Leaf70]
MKASKVSSPSPLQLDIANQVIRLIRTGELAPGQHLTEQALAQRFGVSRTPVRVAFKLLEERGYLLSRANAGVTVSEVLPGEELAGIGMTGEELYLSILSDRVQGQLPDVLSEAELLARYQVPRSVLMRALLRLNHEGLLVRRKGHGWGFQPTLDSDQAKYESYRFRLMVECGGLREKTFRADGETLEQSRQAHLDFLGLDPVEQTSSLFFDINAHFHEMLAGFSGNRFVLESVRHHNQLRRVEEYRRHVHNPVNLSGPCQEHLAILQAVEAGDAELAALLMHQHLLKASRF